MKSSLALALLLSAGLLVHGQDSTHIRKHIPHDKFTTGDIGVRYQLAYNGGLQSQFTASYFVAKRIEVGGTFLLNVDHINSDYQGADSLGNYQITNNGWGYTLGFSPFILGHFLRKDKFDFYVGGLAMFQISNTGTNSFTNYITPPTYFQFNDSWIHNPVQFAIGGGPIIGCQYIFTSRLALGVQVCEWGGYAFVKRNAYSYTQSGMSANPFNSNNSTVPLNFIADAGFGAYAGITLSYYFSAKKKNHRVTG